MTDPSSLVIELASWLPTASPEDLLEYARTIQDKDKDLFADLTNLLPHEILLRIGRLIRTSFDTNLSELVPPSGLISLANALGKYNSTSVIGHYQKLYPTLTATALAPLDPIQAANLTDAWHSCFLLLAAPHYDRDFLYLKSFIHASLDSEALPNLLKKASELLDKITDLLTENNFTPVVPTTAMKKEVMDFMSQIPFFPVEYKEQAAGQRIGEESFVLFQSLENVLEFLTAMGGTGGPDDTELYCTLFWDYLRFDKEVEFLRKADAAFFVRNAGEKIDFSQFEKITSVLTPQLITNGSAQEQLWEQLNLLPADQRPEFVAIVERAVTGSPVIQTLLDPLDVTSFITQLKLRPGSTDHTSYINSLETTYEPQDWSQTKAAMQLLAALF
ncbi:MAG: hypothetical protein WCO52_01785 [bacterium]